MLSERGIRFDCFERLDTVAASLFDSTSGAAQASTCSGGRDGDLAEDVDLRACAIAEAMESYVSRFGLQPRIHFGMAVEYVRRLRGGRWCVHFERSAPRRYDAVIVAAGRCRHRLSTNGADRVHSASLSFLDPEERRALSDGAPLWNHLIHPRYANLFVLSRMPTARLTISVAQEQSKFAASCIAGDCELPTRLQMERERRAVGRSARKPNSNESRCPSSSSDTRYVFHLRKERVRRTHLRHAMSGPTQAVSR